MFFTHRLALALIALNFSLSCAQPTSGPYKTAVTVLPNTALDATNQHVMVTYPIDGAPGQQFPLLAYAHGAAGGGWLDINGYDLFFHQLASWGLVVTAHMSCSIGCRDAKREENKWTQCAGVPLTKPTPAWGSYYAETLKTIDWARNETKNATGDPLFSLIDWSLGVGIAGHSMGGQSTTIAASEACAAAFDIRAAAVHHPEDASLGVRPNSVNAGVFVGVPFASFTSSGDNTCADYLAKDIYDALPSNVTAKAFRDLVGWSHLEPVLIPPAENPLLAKFTAAWMLVFVGQQGPGSESYDMIFGGPSSSDNGTLCVSQPMVECVTVAPTT